MNEYTYEIWSSYIYDCGPFEFFLLRGKEASSVEEIIKIANEDAKNCPMQDTFRYQVRNIKKL